LKLENPEARRLTFFSSSLPAYWRELKKYHLQHHFADYENGFGVTSRFWDRIFGTELPSAPPTKVIKTT
jgi:4-hydroxysphinganine ceramide fatty acyl 2-hydroxylase